MIDRRSLLAATFLAATLCVLPSAAQDTIRLNPNSASEAELAAVEGLSPELAATILAQRPFETMVEFSTLVSASVATDATSALYEQLFIPINLNSASAEEIALIPGMSRRMIREFLEYRPYADIDVFNREIGKYVDEAEVARLRSYVTL
jgi:DNA uptake protein ComE-like DNA-binding protein